MINPHRKIRSAFSWRDARGLSGRHESQASLRSAEKPAAARGALGLRPPLWSITFFLLTLFSLFNLMAPASPVTSPSDPRNDAPSLRTVVSPAAPGATSAYGLLSASPHLGVSSVTIPAGQVVGFIPIEGPIDRYSAVLVRRKVERAIKDGCTVIVFELNTPGGRIDIAMDIASQIKSLSTRNVNTIAYINPQALSAGAFIAAACEEIYIAPGGQTGDAMPVSMFGELADDMKAKALSAWLDGFRDSDRERYALYHAMCLVGIKVFLVEHQDTGEQRLVNQVDHAVMVDGMSRDEAEKAFASDVKVDQTGEVGRPAADTATEEDRGQWRPVDQLPSGQALPDGRVHDGNTLLTLSAKTAIDVGLARDLMATPEDLAKHLGASQTNTYPSTWSEPIARFLTNPIVFGLLLAVMMIAMFVEASAPGIGIGAIVAGTCLVLLLGAPLSVGLAHWWHIALFLLGVLLVVVEVIFVVGFGFVGLAGALLMAVGLIAAVIPNGPGGGLPALTPQSIGTITTYSISMLLSVAAAGVGMFVAAKYFHVIPVFNRLILQDSPEFDADNPNRSTVIAGAETVGTGFAQVDMSGMATTDLRPSGQADIEGRLMDVVSTGTFIAKGKAIVITEVAGNRVVVREA